jgi:SNF2 family DNA or RNA helicase
VALTDYSHQQTGSAFLAERRFALLADDMGLGKTRQVVLACDRVSARKILVVCPGAVREHWALEFEQWSDQERPVHVVEGFLKEPPGPGITIVSHAVLSDATPSAKRPNRGQSLRHLFSGPPFDVIVVDEAHEFRQYQAARTRTLFAPDGLVSRASQMWCLSGTPIVNSAADFYPMLYGGLGSQVTWQEFCDHYCTMVPDAYQETKPVGIKNTEELAFILKPYVIRRTAESLDIKMPNLTVTRVPVKIDDNALQHIMAGLEGWTPARLQEALAEQDDLRDSALARVRRALGLAKLDTAAAHIHSIVVAGEGPVVAFFQHTDVRKGVFDRLKARGHQLSWIDGTVSRAQLRAAKEWLQGGWLNDLLVQTQAGGMGLTLTRSHRVVVIELPWTATALQQAIKRIHRIGQTADCTAEILSAAGCWLDEAMAGVVGVKERASNDLLSRLTTNI